jgi:G3E family GTPase
VNKVDISSQVDSNRHFILIGGFLGAGKTTIIGKLTQYLEKNCKKVALITNDQGEGLMDTASARNASLGSQNIAEITGGCFCCRLDELVDSIKVLDDSTRPDVMIAEPVGSCTDLMATVLQPLEKIYQTPLTLAPLAVVLDARRALATLGGRKKHRSFHRDVGYVYLKQLEEAEWLIANKCDLLNDSDLENLRSIISQKYPTRKLHFVSAKSGDGLEVFFSDLLGNESSPGKMMEVDYERYAEGEAMLGWVNLAAEVLLSAAPGPWLQSLGEKVAAALAANEHEVGHFKMSLTGQGKRWRVHQVMGSEEVELFEEEVSADDPSGAPELRMLVNLRAEGDAKRLQAYVHAALDEQTEARVSFHQQAAFQPGKPEPTHRIA